MSLPGGKRQLICQLSGASILLSLAGAAGAVEALEPAEAAGAAFNPYQLVQIALHIADRIDFQWGLFITVHLALFGGIIYVDRPLRRLEKLGALIIYSGFAWLSYRLMDGQLTLLLQAYADIESLFRQPCCSDSAILDRMVQAMEQGKLDFNRLLIRWAHGAMLLLVAATVVLDQEINKAIHRLGNESQQDQDAG